MRQIASIKKIGLMLFLLAGVSLFLYNDGYGLYLDENSLPRIDTFTKSPTEKVYVRGKTYYCLETWDDYFQINRNWIIKPKKLIQYELNEETMIRDLYNEIKE